MLNNNGNSFETFFECWLMTQEEYLKKLLLLIEQNRTGEENVEDKIEELIGQVLVHYNQYYEAKTRVVSENVFLALTPPWLSSFERAYLWIGGFRPGLAFRLVNNNVKDLTEDQSQRVNGLIAEIKEEEKGLSDELARIQEAVGFPTMVELARNVGRLRNGEASRMDSAIEGLRVSMEALVGSADFLRRKTAVKLMQILKPAQAAKFLAAAAQFQLRFHRWGMQRETQVTRG